MIRKITVALLWVTFCAALSLALVWAGMEAAIRESEARDEIRKERCARWGEDLPPEYEGYCKNLGV